MTNARVIIHAAEPAALVDELRTRHPDLDTESCSDYDGLPNLLKTFRPDVVYSIRFAGTPGYPKEALFGEDGPRWLAVGGSGIDHLGHWNPDKTIVTNAAGVAAGMMAEYAIGGMIHFALDIPGLQRDQEERRWQERTVKSISGKTLLIVGLGHTGQAVAARSKAFGMRVIGTRAHPCEMENVDRVYGTSDLPELWAEADFIVVCAPLLDSTRGLIDEKAFANMKPGTVLVDVSRGGIIVQSALIETLISGHLGGAFLDVFETEPLPPENPLWEMDNVLISPHCSSVTSDWEQASLRLFSENLSHWRDGKPLMNIVDPVRGY